MRSAPSRDKKTASVSSLFTKDKRKLVSGRDKRKIVDRSNKKYFTQMFVGAGIFTAAVLFLAGFSIIKYLNQAFASASSISSYDLNSESVVTLSFIEVADLNSDPLILKNLKYVIYDKANSKISYFDIPLGVNVDMAGKFGIDAVSKSFALGALNAEDKIQAGIEAVDSVVLKIFAYKIDRYVLVNSDNSKDLLDSLTGAGILKFINPQKAAILKKSTISNLTIAEYYSLVNFAHSIPKDKISNYSVSQNDVDNSQAIDEFIQNISFDKAPASEDFSVSILNGTNFPGVASFGARLVTNAGGRVVSVNNASKQYETSFIISDNVDSKLLRYIAHSFGIGQVVSKDKASSFGESEIDMSDITVIIGFDSPGIL